MFTAIRQWVIRTMLKSKGQTGIVKTLPNKDLVELNTQITAQRLMQGGIEPNSLKNADQVENAVIAIETKEKANLAENIRGGIGSTKSAKVFDMEGKEIPPGSRIMGGKELTDSPLDDLKSIVEDFKPMGDQPPPGSRGGKDDIAAPFASQEETMSNMIKDELMKTDNAFSDLVKTTEKGPKTLKEREAEVLARMNKENKEAAQRIKNRKMVKDAIDNASPGFVRGDRKYNAQLVADDLAEKKFGKEYYDLDQTQQLDLYDEALEGYDELTRGMPDPEDFAQGGRAGFKFGLGPLFNFLNKKSPAKAYMDYLESVKKRMKAGKEAEVAGEVIPIAAGGALITNQLKKKLKAMNEEQKKKIEKEAQEELRKDMKKADGGRIGYDKGSKLTDFIDIQASGTKSGKKQLQGAPDGITIDSESFNAIAKADIPISQKIDLILEYK